MDRCALQICAHFSMLFQDRFEADSLYFNGFVSFEYVIIFDVCGCINEYACRFELASNTAV